MAEPPAELDRRFSSPGATPRPWSEVVNVLEYAEIFWLSTVRHDGRPHVTPLPAMWLDGSLHFCTGPAEQKARNLETNPRCVLTTGTDRFRSGLDVIVEGTAVRVEDAESLQRAADAYLDKYGDDWRFDVGDGVLTHGEAGEMEAALLRVEPTKVLAFAKDPHGQTRYRFV
jgi:general stress protein 26